MAGGGLALIIVGTIAYRSYARPKAETLYAMASAHRGLLIVSLTGTGQVSGEHQIDVKPKVSSEVVILLAKPGQSIKKDEVIAMLNPRNALKTVRDAAQSVHDAEVSLSSAKLSFEKLKQPPTATNLLLAENAARQARRDLEKLLAPPNAYDVQQAEAQVTSAEQNTKISADGKTPQGIRNAYDTSIATLKTSMQALQKSLVDADGVVAVDNLNANASFARLILDQNKLMLATHQYALAKTSIAQAKIAVDLLADENEDPTKIDAAMLLVKDALNTMSTLLATTYDVLLSTLTSSSFSASSLDALKSTVQGDRTDTTSKISSLTSQGQAIVQARTSYDSAQLSLQQAQISLEKLRQGPAQRDVDAAQEKVKEKEQALADVKAGPTAMDLALAQNNVDQRAVALAAVRSKWTDAREALGDYTVRAPFDGIVAKVSVQNTDAVSAATPIVTLIARQKVAEITLNEVDAAKVKVGQKVTLTFDAVDGLSISGEVVEVGTLGTVTQGVVNYTAKIGFDTQDERVKPGMSVRAAIILETKSDVVLVPNAAVKASGNRRYVETLQGAASSSAATAQAGGLITGAPQPQTVEVGAANDSETEITSGLNGTESVVVQTILPASATKAASSGSSGVRLPGLGGGGGGGGAFRGGGGR